jgi:hypothetical protein
MLRHPHSYSRRSPSTNRPRCDSKYIAAGFQTAHFKGLYRKRSGVWSSPLPESSSRRSVSDTALALNAVLLGAAGGGCFPGSPDVSRRLAPALILKRILAGRSASICGSLQTSYALLRLAGRADGALRVRGLLADDITTRVINTLLVRVLWCVFDVAVIIPLHATHKLTSRAEASCLVLIFAVAVNLLYRDSLRTGSLVYLSGIWLSATVVIAFNTGFDGQYVVFYVALPISTSWLGGYQGGPPLCGAMPRYLPEAWRELVKYAKGAALKPRIGTLGRIGSR